MFPDGTGPALLSCLIAGVPLNRVHELEFHPGEIRCDVNYESVNALASRPPSQSYLDALERGRVELRQLREDPDALRNVKDLEYEREREEEIRKQEARRKERAEADELERQRREARERESREAEARRKEEAKAREDEKRRKREEENREREAEKQEAKKQATKKQEAKKQGKAEEGLQLKDGKSDLGVGTIGAVGTLLAGVAIAASLGGGDETEQVTNGGPSLATIAVDNESSLNSTTPVVNPKNNHSDGLLSENVDVKDEDNSASLDGNNEAEEIVNGVTISTAIADNNESSLKVVDPGDYNSDVLVGANDDVEDGGNDTTDGGSESSLDITARDTTARPVDFDVDDDTFSDDLEGATSATEAFLGGATVEMLNGDGDVSMNGQQQQSDNEYDWEEDWLGSIAEIMNDGVGEEESLP